MGGIGRGAGYARGVPDSPLQRLRRLREHRGPRTPQVLLRDEVGEIRRELTQQQRGASKSQAWLVEALPASLRDRCEVMGLRAGVLRIRVSDPSANDLLSRWLRSGGEQQLRLAAKAPVRRVRVEVR